MMFQVDDDGVVSSVNEDDLIYIDKNELDKFVESYRKLEKENEQLKKDVEYWKQVASQYSNELNVFKHCKEHKTKCKNIHWSSD